MSAGVKRRASGVEPALSAAGAGGEGLMSTAACQPDAGGHQPGLSTFQSGHMIFATQAPDQSVIAGLTPQG